MKNFYLEIPTRAYFGRETAMDSLDKEKNILGEKVLVVTTSKSLFQNGFMKQLTDKLEEIVGINNAFVYSDFTPDPQLSDIRKAIAFGKSKGITSVIGFGGGSSIDAAKATALGIGSEDTIDRYYYDGIQCEKKCIPVIAIPTTAGTGSELSGSAVISDANTNMKKGIRGWFMYPDVAIVDPHYTDNMPPKLTKDTGFDALAHAIETYVSVKATRMSDRLSEDAISIIAEALPALYLNSNDLDARDAMSYASMTMGINLGNVGTLLPHRLQYPVGTKTHTSHGEGLLAIFPAWFQATYTCSPEKICKVATLLSGKKCASQEECVKALDNFISSIGNRIGLRGLGVEDDDIEKFSKNIVSTFKNDPLYDGGPIIERLYRNSME